MSFPDITELSNAYVLCSCSQVCTRSCTVCASVTWRSGACIKQLWAEHGSSEAGKAAAQRFDDMIKDAPEPTLCVIPLPDMPFEYQPRYVTLYSDPDNRIATVPVNPDGTVTFTVPEPENTLHVEVIEGGKQASPPHIPRFDVNPHNLRTKAIEKWIDLIDAEVGLEPWQARIIRWMLDGSPTRQR